MLLALPGAAYIYNGQELGLPNVDDLADDDLQDPIWERTGRTHPRPRRLPRCPCRGPRRDRTSASRPRRSRRGCRSRLPGLHFSVQRQDGDWRSMLELYRSALRVRRASSVLGRGELRWVDSDVDPADLLELDLVGSEETVRVLLNLSDDPVAVPAGDLLLASEPVVDGLLPGASAAWVRLGS